MLNGTYVFKGSGTTYSPTFPRGGLAALFTTYILQLVGSPVLTIAVEHKNHDDTAFVNAGSFVTISAVGSDSIDLAGLKEEIRFTYTIAATNAWPTFRNSRAH